MGLMHLLRLIRIIDLLLLAVLMTGLFFVIHEEFLTGTHNDIKATWLFILFEVGLLCCLGSAFVYNELADHKRGRKIPDELILINKKIPEAKAKRFFLMLLGFGGSITITATLAHNGISFILLPTATISLFFIYSFFSKDNYIRVPIASLAYALLILTPLFFIENTYSVKLFESSIAAPLYFMFVGLSTIIFFIRENIRYLDYTRFPIGRKNNILRFLITFLAWLTLSLSIFIGYKYYSALGGLFAIFFLCFFIVPYGIAWVFGSFGNSSFEFKKAAMWYKHAIFTLFLFLIFTILIS